MRLWPTTRAPKVKAPTQSAYAQRKAKLAAGADAPFDAEST